MQDWDEYIELKTMKGPSGHDFLEEELNIPTWCDQCGEILNIFEGSLKVNSKLHRGLKECNGYAVQLSDEVKELKCTI
ncbi:unnamed protein product [Darwinula stevensoni]|uniref:Uncharacterized protein n=1 Tax=Darwinula stevensoni TaxID=69355 RepID=A0A7R9A0J0_9CRUS|nr:unnamed protein product [Darwinula stevensoni]CAG0881208.1 unnamed protein product [Darwinula stevensoni]